jgi:hypothetical protein
MIVTFAAHAAQAFPYVAPSSPHTGLYSMVQATLSTPSRPFIHSHAWSSLFRLIVMCAALIIKIMKNPLVSRSSGLVLVSTSAS